MELLKLLVIAFMVLSVGCGEGHEDLVVEEIVTPALNPESKLADNLSSSDNALIRESLTILTHRGASIEIPKAIELLESDDEYVWINAAQYLGANKRTEAVPHLIKSLRHTAWRSDEERAGYLHEITGEDFGTDFSKWQAWWIAANPNVEIDWESYLGFRPRLGPKNAQETDGQSATVVPSKPHSQTQP